MKCSVVVFSYVRYSNTNLALLCYYYLPCVQHREMTAIFIFLYHADAFFDLIECFFLPYRIGNLLPVFHWFC